MNHLAYRQTLEPCPLCLKRARGRIMYETEEGGTQVLPICSTCDMVDEFPRVKEQMA